MSTNRIIVATIILVAAGVAVPLASDQVRWRTEIVAMKAAGRLEGIDWARLLKMMMPGSPYAISALRNEPNPFAVIRNPYDSGADREVGAELFRANCVLCHAADGSGQAGPSLLNPELRHGYADLALYNAVVDGFPATGMPPVQLSEREAWQVVSHVRRLRAARVAAVESGTAEKAEFPDTLAVSAERIEHADSEPANWLTYSGSYRSWRYSTLDEITPDNVARLRLAWATDVVLNEVIESSPLVVDGVMYTTEPPGNVVALSAATGKVLWRYSRTPPAELSLCCGRVNRGVAMLGERIFVGTLDGHLLALDARTGKLLWDVEVADHEDGYSITAAPLAVRDKVIIGVSGGEYGIRGFLDAYDAETGARRWRFNTIPAPGEYGSETWGGDSWRTGGGPTWMTGSFDPVHGLLYWGVGNPGPLYNGDSRPGDNLFTDSVVALNLETGRRVWHFQFTPHDERDWDATQVPVLVDHELDGVTRQLMVWPNRNGFYYVLDRVNGEFLHAVPYVRQNWAERIDETGRPVLIANASPSPGGTLTSPGSGGGANWWSPSYSPRTHLLYVPLVEAPKVIFKGVDADAFERVPGQPYLGSGYTHAADVPARGGVRALDPISGATVWEHLSAPRQNFPAVGGVLTTAGDVLFMGLLTEFLAFDARTGKELWRINLGGFIKAAPITFEANGRQMVSIPAGNSRFTFQL